MRPLENRAGANREIELALIAAIEATLAGRDPLASYAGWTNWPDGPEAGFEVQSRRLWIGDESKELEGADSGFAHLVLSQVGRVHALTIKRVARTVIDWISDARRWINSQNRIYAIDHEVCAAHHRPFRTIRQPKVDASSPAEGVPFNNGYPLVIQEEGFVGPNLIAYPNLNSFQSLCHNFLHELIVHNYLTGVKYIVPNLITSCFDCNRGKRAKIISEIAPRPDADIAMLKVQQELVEVKRFLAAKRKRDAAIRQVVTALRNCWAECLEVDPPEDREFSSWATRYGPEEVEASIRIVAPMCLGGRFRYNSDLKAYIGGILRKRERDADGQD